MFWSPTFVRNVYGTRSRCILIIEQHFLLLLLLTSTFHIRLVRRFFFSFSITTSNKFFHLVRLSAKKPLHNNPIQKIYIFFVLFTRSKLAVIFALYYLIVQKIIGGRCSYIKSQTNELS